MKNCRNGVTLILIEGENITSHCLEDKDTWEIGRYSADNNPDIALTAKTVSRKHGKFQNLDGGGKNGTLYNGR